MCFVKAILCPSCNCGVNRLTLDGNVYVVQFWFNLCPLDYYLLTDLGQDLRKLYKNDIKETYPPLLDTCYTHTNTHTHTPSHTHTQSYAGQTYTLKSKILQDKTNNWGQKFIFDSNVPCLTLGFKMTRSELCMYF